MGFLRHSLKKMRRVSFFFIQLDCNYSCLDGQPMPSCTEQHCVSTLLLLAYERKFLITVFIMEPQIILQFVTIRIKKFLNLSKRILFHQSLQRDNSVLHPSFPLAEFPSPPQSPALPLIPPTHSPSKAHSYPWTPCHPPTPPPPPSSPEKLPQFPPACYQSRISMFGPSSCTTSLPSARAFHLYNKIIFQKAH